MRDSRIESTENSMQETGKGLFARMAFRNFLRLEFSAARMLHVSTGGGIPDERIAPSIFLGVLS